MCGCVLDGRSWGHVHRLLLVSGLSRGRPFVVSPAAFGLRSSLGGPSNAFLRLIPTVLFSCSIVWLFSSLALAAAAVGRSLDG